MGRWATPDWDARPVTVPYANFGDSQSLNLYLYVRNDPVSQADADGHISNDSGGQSCLDSFMCYVQYQQHMKDNQPSGWFTIISSYSSSDDNSEQTSDQPEKKEEKGSRPLNEAERKALGPFLTQDQLDHARIHNGKPLWLRIWAKVHIAKSTEHAAVTVGNNIYFPKGEYIGQTTDDLAWLAHELFHVDQYQRGELTLLKYAEEAMKHGIGPGNKYEDPANSYADNIYKILSGQVTQGDRELGP